MPDPAADEPTTREIIITRVYDASRELVWKAWTEPEQLARWWGKRGWTARLSTITMDVRPGGTFRVTSVSDEDGRELVTDGVYGQVVEPECLEFGDAAVLLTDLGDGRTEMVFRTTIDATEELRRTAEGGLWSAFERLAEHLTISTDPPPTTKEHA